MQVTQNADLPIRPGTRNQRNLYCIGELFSSAGGMVIGAHSARSANSGFRHVWVNDVDEDACNTLQQNISISKDGVFRCKVQELDFQALPAIDGLVFGFPCNDFSVVGDRKGISGEYGVLYHFGVQALKELKPSFFVAENVGGLASSGQNKDYNVIFDSLTNVGYDVSCHKYKFEEYGIPQTRHRLIFVGFRKDLNVNFQHPLPKAGTKAKTCKEALANLPEDAPNNERTKQAPSVVERLRHIKPGENAFTADLPDHLKLKLKSNAKISQIYKRLRPDQPAYTVTGSGGGGTHVYHWDEPRALTNRERARLQTFSDDFIFSGSKESVRKQIGMAVPPDGARIIFQAVLETLFEYSIPPLHANHTLTGFESSQIEILNETDPK